MEHYIEHIWIGQFGHEAPREYFVQKYHDSDDATCQFSSDQNQTSFDYDFVEISWGLEMKPVREFITGHSYFESYLDEVEMLAKKLGVAAINVFVLANEDEFRSPCTVEGNDFKLWYLGKFECFSE
jgi:hypothetical protein